MSREPANKNWLKPNSFRFTVLNLPAVEYFCQKANIPRIGFGAAKQTTPFVDISHIGEKIEFSELNIEFLIDEDMANYMEVLNWMYGIGFPKSHQQYTRYIQRQEHNPFAASATPRAEAAYSDAIMYIMNNNNMPILEVRYYDIFPTNLESVDFDLRVPTAHSMTAMATFDYKFMDIVPIGKEYNPNY